MNFRFIYRVRQHRQRRNKQNARKKNDNLIQKYSFHILPKLNVQNHMPYEIFVRRLKKLKIT